MSQSRSLFLGVVWGAFAAASSVDAQCLFTALSETRHDTSAPLCTLTSAAGAPPTAPAAAPPGLFLTTAETDPVLQTSATTSLNAVLNHNIIGLGGNFVGPQGAFTPPGLAADPNGAAGTTQYMQWVNSAVAVFSKSTGAPTCGPIYDPWRGFGADEEAEVTQPIEALAEHLERGDGEVGRGDIERAAAVLSQQRAEHVDQPVRLVVDDVGNPHGSVRWISAVVHLNRPILAVECALGPVLR